MERAVSVTLMACRITIPTHLEHDQWFGTVVKLTQHTDAKIQDSAVTTLRDLIVHYPGSFINSFY